VAKREGDYDQLRLPDKIEVSCQWIGLDGWKCVIRKKHVGERWKDAQVEVYTELVPGELLDVLEGSIGSWLAT
jgi:hypothetical protein